MEQHSNERMAAAIGMMLASFPASSQPADMVAMAYMGIVSNCRVEAVERAAREFMAGQVADHDRRFCPSTAQFAERVRECEHEDELYARYGDRPALPKPDEDRPDNWPPPRTEEQKAKAAALLSKFQADMAEISREAFGKPQPLPRMDAVAFDPGRDEDEARRRLVKPYWQAGDPDYDAPESETLPNTQRTA